MITSSTEPSDPSSGVDNNTSLSSLAELIISKSVFR